MAEAGTFERILGEIGQALLPLREALASPEAFGQFAFELGWRADDIPQPLRDLAGGMETLYDELRRMLGEGAVSVGGSVGLSGASASASFGADDVQRVVHAVQQIINGINGIAGAPDAAIPASLRADGFREHFPRQLLDFLVLSYLRRRMPTAGFALKSLGVIKTSYTAEVGNRPAFMAHTFDFSDLPKVLSEPSLVLRNAYGWGTADLDFSALAAQVDNLLYSVGVDTVIDELDPQTEIAVRGASGGSSRAVRAVFFERPLPSGRMAAEIRLVELPPAGGLPGLAVLPAFNGLLDFQFQLGPDIAVKIRSDLALAGGVALQMRPGQPIEVIVGFDGTGGVTGAKGSIEVRADRSATDGQPIIVLGGPGRTRLQFRKLGGAGGVRLHDGEVDIFAEFELKGLEFVLEAGEGDGFISKILPSGGVGFGTDLTLGISHRDGFYFRGTSHLEIQVPAHVQLGPVEIQALSIAANPDGAALPITLGTTFTASLGPLRATVEKIGLTARFEFRDKSDGNLGPVHLTIGFKPPNGVGLAVDAGVVSGGGYLFIDEEKGEYAGALELSFAKLFTIRAIGIISTKTPDGKPGFSLLILASVEFASGIQLGFGFTLLAVGGLLGLNRSANLQALADGVRSGSVTSVMFPRDIIANAPRIISDLRAFFPAKDGTFLIGPMVKLGWGTPTLVSLSVGVIIEIPGNIAILGVLKVALPSEDAPLILIQVQFIGAIEFDKKRLWFFASLFDSRVVFITIDGEMGLLVGWGDDANFVVSVGGFHPRFSPPPLPFPSPRRISIPLYNTPVARVRAEGYFAVTSNTAQFGARVEIFFGLSALNVQGHLAIDALFQFSPFHFIIEISASFSVKVFGAGLFSVGVSGQLDGPAPWHIKGHGSISLLFWDIDVDFEDTWGDSRDTRLDPVAVLPILVTELGKSETWRALPPGGGPLLVTTRPMDAAEAETILHPMGVLRVSQRAVPLDLHLDRVGNRKPSDVNRIHLEVAPGGLDRKADATEPFAPAQFRDFSDADKLSQPAFAPEHSGLELSASGRDVRTSHLVKRVLRYEQVIIDSNFKRFVHRFHSGLRTLIELFLGGNAASRSVLSAATKSQLQPFDEKITVAAPTFTVAFQATNKVYASATFTSAARAHDFLAGTAAADPNLAETLHVIPGHEVSA